MLPWSATLTNCYLAWRYDASRCHLHALDLWSLCSAKNLIALGEAVKGLDKQTHGELLPRYPEVYWSGVMRMRDKIAHHYFEIDTDVVFRTVQEDVPQMKDVINRMIADIEGI